MSLYHLSRRRFLSTAGGVAGAAASGALGLPRLARAQNGPLNIRARRDISSLDPGYMVGGSEIDVEDSILPRVAQYTYGPEGLGAGPAWHTESVTQRDPLHIDFKLRPGLMWTNGYGEVTAEDVKFSFERLKTSDWAGDWEAMERVDVTGTHTGTIVLNKAFAPFWLSALAGSTGASAHRIPWLQQSGEVVPGLRPAGNHPPGQDQQGKVPEGEAVTRGHRAERPADPQEANTPGFPCPVHLEQRLARLVLEIARIYIVKRHQRSVRHTTPGLETASHMSFRRPGKPPEIPPQDKGCDNAEENEKGDLEYPGER